MPVLEKILNLGSGRKLKFYQTQLKSIEHWEEELSAYTDQEIQERIQEIKKEIQELAKAPSEFLIEVFALTREASSRSLGMTHFPVQLIGGMAIFDGNIAEMQTGEGKTLTATLPAILRCLEGKGVHVVTVNDYLAHRDANWMKPLYDFLGISIGVIYSDMPHDKKVEAYQADITYGTNSEFGFDYLRDNLAWDKNGQVARRGYHFAIIDEIDNILIDEARTPLIISDIPNRSSDLYANFAAAAKKMVLGEKPEDFNPRLNRGWEPDYDYEVDEKHKTVSITDQGVKTAEKLLGFDNIYKADSAHLVNHLIQALKAQSLYKKDKDYAVIDNEIKIIDEFTGRIMEGRRWSDGLHQAVEAKEKVAVQDENVTVASVTYQNFFRKYEVLSGMTGTASTEANEFHKIYELDVVVIPPNRPKQRIDHEDLMFARQEHKWKAVVEEIKHLHEKRQPVLVGTVSVSDSEQLSKLLSQEGLKHSLLNAKPEYAEQEGNIVAQAGRLGAVTIATNMAGRGVDIKLGGDYQGLAEEYMSKLPSKKRTEEEIEEQRLEVTERFKQEVEQEAQKIRELGGLAIIGTERHESRRIDNQLRGRSGRQGDPGETRFYISAEDDLMRLFGGDMMKKTLLMMGSDDRPIKHRMLTKRIETAQKKVEEQRFLERKNVIDYDDVMNMQREAVYNWRHRILEGDDLKQSLLDRIRYAVNIIVAEYTEGEFSEDWDYPGLYQRVLDICPTIELEFEEFEKTETPEELGEIIFTRLEEAHEAREELITPQYMRQFERMLVLKVLDERWREHLTDMDYMQESIHLRGFAQVEPLVAYKNEASTLFEGFINEVWIQLTSIIFNLEFKVESEKDGILFSTHLQPEHKDPSASQEAKMNRATRRQKNKKRRKK